MFHIRYQIDFIVSKFEFEFNQKVIISTQVMWSYSKEQINNFKVGGQQI